MGVNDRSKTTSDENMGKRVGDKVGQGSGLFLKGGVLYFYKTTNNLRRNESYRTQWDYRK